MKILLAIFFCFALVLGAMGAGISISSINGQAYGLTFYSLVTNKAVEQPSVNATNFLAIDQHGKELGLPLTTLLGELGGLSLVNAQDLMRTNPVPVPSAIFAQKATNLAATYVTNIYAFKDFQHVYVIGSTDATINVNPYTRKGDDFIITNDLSHALAFTNINGYMIWDVHGYGIPNIDNSQPPLYIQALGFVLTTTHPDNTFGTDLFYENGNTNDPGNLTGLPTIVNCAALEGTWYGYASINGGTITVTLGTNYVTNIVATTAQTITNSDITVDSVCGNDSTASIGGLPFRTINMAQAVARPGDFWHVKHGFYDISFIADGQGWKPCNSTIYCEPGAVFGLTNVWTQQGINPLGSFEMDNATIHAPHNYGDGIIIFDPINCSNRAIFHNLTADAGWSSFQAQGIGDVPLKILIEGCDFAQGSFGIEIVSDEKGITNVEVHIKNSIVRENGWRIGGDGNLRAMHLTGCRAFVESCNIIFSNNTLQLPIGIQADANSMVSVNGITFDESQCTFPTNAMWYVALNSAYAPMQIYGTCPTNRIKGTNYQFVVNYNGVSLTNCSTTYFTNIVSGRQQTNTSSLSMTWRVPVLVSAPATTTGYAEVDAQVQTPGGPYLTIDAVSVSGATTSVIATNRGTLVFEVPPGCGYVVTNNLSGTGYAAALDNAKTNQLTLHP